MFSGKTEELIRRVNRAKIAKQDVIIFKPKIDTRYHESNVVSHNANSIDSVPVGSSMEVYGLAQGFDVVAIDEVQFFDNDIAHVCNQLADKGIRVIAAGLDMDAFGKPFGAMPELICIAEHVTKVSAVCMQCGDVASHTYRKTESEEQVLLGEKDIYEARCRTCYNN